MKTRVHAPHTGSRGFTLIEILIVVIILGTLASIVIAQFTGVSDDAEKTAFITSGRTFVDAAQRYRLDTGRFPNGAPGQLPPGFGDYVTAHQWEGVTPIGGLWDSATDAYGFTASLGVFFGAGAPSPHQDDAYMQKIDALIDDGDLTTGSFQKVANTRYFYVVAF
ncbi:MAG: prepilin-type N-terminal cleavage/methylation domain-containing protein [Planctomycetota bacterium]|jgi:prepilin-type N-terminal cleavage/methylation domain-containing protein